MSASWYMALENVERHQERTLHTPWSHLWIMTASSNPMFIPRAQGKDQDPASHRPSRWVGSECSRPLGAAEEEGQDGNWNPIYLARLTRAFCPSLSGVPQSPILVISFSFKSCKSYVEIEKEKKKENKTWKSLSIWYLQSKETDILYYEKT